MKQVWLWMGKLGKFRPVGRGLQGDVKFWGVVFAIYVVFVKVNYINI